MKIFQSYNNIDLFKALSSLTHVVSKKTFIAWTRDELQVVFPHEIFIGGIGKVDSSGVVPFDIVTWNFPEEYLNTLRLNHRHYSTFIMENWLQTSQPQLFDSDNLSADADSQWLKNFRMSGLCNTAAYGLFDITEQYASYFSFHKIPEPLGEEHKLLLKIIVPNMHSALLNIMREDRANLNELNDSPTITIREREVLVWICEGKTSAEIAFILGVSCKTIANHAQSILEKLGVHNRAQAVAAAYRLKLVRSRSR